MLALVLGVTIVVPLESYFALINSRAPPFPVAWEVRLPKGQVQLKTLVGHGVVYSLRSLTPVSVGQSNCTYQIVAIGAPNGSLLWSSDSIHTSGLCSLYTNLFYDDGMIHFVGYTQNGSLSELRTTTLDARIGRVVSTFTEPIPGGFAFSIFATSFRGTLFLGGVAYSGQPANSTVLSVESVSMIDGSRAWERSILVPGKNGWANFEPGLQADSQGLTLAVSDQSRIYLVELMTNGTIGYEGFLPGSGVPESCCSILSLSSPFMNRTFYYLERTMNYPRVYGVRLTDRELVTNFSAHAVVQTFGSADVVSVIQDKLMVSNNVGVVAYSKDGSPLWSFLVQNESSINAISLIPLSDGWVFLEEDNSHLYYSSGTLYSGAFAIVNATDGRAGWYRQYRPWVSPPWTDPSLPGYYALGVASEFLVFSDGSTLYGVNGKSLG